MVPKSTQTRASLGLQRKVIMSISNTRLNALIRQAKASGRDVVETDGTVPGLTLIARPTGATSWQFRYYRAGLRKKITIGQYPAWGIADAREEAKRLRREVDTGIDVALEKRRREQEARSTWTVDDLARYYFGMAEKDLAPHTYRQRVRQYETYIKPAYGGIPVNQVRPADIGANVRASASAGKTLPRNILIAWTQFFHVAVGQGMVPVNPCRDLKVSAIIGKEAPPKQRTALTADELGPFLRALTEIPRPYELAIRMLLLTGVRVSQLSEARVDEFDLDRGIWAIPSERRKNRRYTQGPLELPLPKEAVGWVRELLRIADRSEYLFHQEGRRHVEGRTPRSKGNTFTAWLDRLHRQHGQWRRVTPHDLRATCKSCLAELRVDYEVRQRYLDHQTGTTMDAIYDKSNLFDQKADAARRLLAHLNRLEADASGQKVVSIR